MSGKDIEITAGEGGAFACYLALPEARKVPAAVIVPSVYGVDQDIRRNADDLAAQGFIAAAPDMFWRSDPGPMSRDEDGARRASARAKDRAPLIEQGVQDLADTVAYLKNLPQSNGKVAVIGFCYGGPYALLGPARLGCDAGISFHGTQVQNYLDALENIQVPLSLHWGDQDHAAPPDTMAQIKAAVADMPNVTFVVYPGVAHGYTAPSSTKAWNAAAAADSWRHAVAILERLQRSEEMAG